MTRAQIIRAGAVGPLVLSALAFATVMTNILAGVPPQPDETASAHLWQLLMVVQVPLIVLFAATADWRRRASALMIGGQIAAFAIACLPVWIAGY